MSYVAGTMTETDVLNQLLTAEEQGFTLDSARALLSLRFSSTAIDRMNELAAKNQQGTLTDAERADLEKFLRVGNFLNIVQAKAHHFSSVSARTDN